MYSFRTKHSPIRVTQNADAISLHFLIDFQLAVVPPKSAILMLSYWSKQILRQCLWAYIRFMFINAYPSISAHYRQIAVIAFINTKGL